MSFNYDVKMGEGVGDVVMGDRSRQAQYIRAAASPCNIPSSIDQRSSSSQHSLPHLAALHPQKKSTKKTSDLRRRDASDVRQRRHPTIQTPDPPPLRPMATNQLQQHIHQHLLRRRRGPPRKNLGKSFHSSNRLGDLDIWSLLCLRMRIHHHPAVVVDFTLSFREIDSWE